MISLRHIQPLSDRILLLRLPPLPSTNLVVPECAQKPSHRGAVVAMGKGKRFHDGGHRPIGVGPGDVVHYQSFDYDDGEYVLIAEGDILGIEDAV